MYYVTSPLRKHRYFYYEHEPVSAQERPYSSSTSDTALQSNRQKHICILQRDMFRYVSKPLRYRRFPIPGEKTAETEYEQKKPAYKSGFDMPQTDAVIEMPITDDSPVSDALQNEDQVHDLSSEVAGSLHFKEEHTDNLEVIPKESRRERKKREKAEKKAAKKEKKKQKRIQKMEKKLGRAVDDVPTEFTEPEAGTADEKNGKKKRRIKGKTTSDKDKESLKQEGRQKLKPAKKKFSLYDEVIDEEKVKEDKIDKMINQDGYYDVLKPIDEASKVQVKKQKNTQKTVVLVILCGIAAALVAFIVLTIASIF